MAQDEAPESGTDRGKAAAPASPRERNASVEALRVIAILAIAVFHTFQDPFYSLVESVSQQGAAGLAQIAGLAVGDGTVLVPGVPALWVLGCISLLGAFGNHVFFAISGCFLIPGAAERSTRPGYWSDELRRFARRAKPIIATVAFYAVIALALSATVLPMPGISLARADWLVGGLQFIWVYLVLVAAAPVMGWVWRRCPGRLAVVAVLAVAVFALNAYIAFVSPGEVERSLLEWRKLMSAVSYLVSFLAGGALGELKRSGSPFLAGRLPRFGLTACIGLAVAVVGVAACVGDARIVYALSYKSTSLLSFALALTSLGFALTVPHSRPRPSDGLVRRAARGTLGFYTAQSMASAAWHPCAEAAMASAYGLGEGLALGMCQAPGADAAAGFAAMVGTGAAWSLLFLAALLLFDLAVRAPLLRRLGC